MELILGALLCLYVTEAALLDSRDPTAGREFIAE